MRPILFHYLPEENVDNRIHSVAFNYLCHPRDNIDIYERDRINRQTITAAVKYIDGDAIELPQTLLFLPI